MFIFTVNTCVLSSQELCYYPTKPVVLITTIFNERLRQPCFVSDTHPLPAYFLTHIPSPCFVSTAHTCAHSLHTHTHTHTPTHTHTHTPSSSPPLDHVGERWPWTCLAPPPHQFVTATNPQHTPPSLCMQAFPWQRWCGGACLATRRLSLLPIWLMVWGFADWAECRLIADKRSYVHLVLLLWGLKSKHYMLRVSIKIHLCR